MSVDVHAELDGHQARTETTPYVGIAAHAEAHPAPLRGIIPTAATGQAEQEAGRAVAELRDPLADVGTVVVAATAGISSWAGWVSLGRSVGWSSLGPVDLAWLLPVSVDVYAFVALRTWNNAHLPDSTRQVGKWSAIGALALSIAGNAAGHAVDAGAFRPSWYVVVLVAALAPILLFLILHLRVLRTRDQATAARAARERAERRAARAAAPPADRPKIRPAPKPTEQATRPARPVAPKADDDRLVDRLLELDRQRGGEIGRDTIVRELGVGSGRAKRIRQLARDRSGKEPAHDACEHENRPGRGCRQQPCAPGVPSHPSDRSGGRTAPADEYRSYQTGADRG